MAKTLEERKCIECQQKYTPSYKPQRYCSRKCSTNAIARQNKHKNIYVATCGWCKKTFEKFKWQKGKHNDFCDQECSQAYFRGYQEKYITKQCPACKKAFKCLYRRQPVNCSRSCSKAGDNHPYYGKVGPFKGKTPWTKGLTAKTDLRVAALGKKISKTQKKQFADGVRTNHGVKNPNYGQRAHLRPLEQIDRYSKAAVRRLQKHGAKIKGIFWSNKNNKHINYRSSYEKRYMVCLENDQNIARYEFEPMSIKYCDNNSRPHRYIPDFLVTYTDGKRQLVEVKCEYTSKVYYFEEKKKAAEEWAATNNSSFVTVMLKEIEEYEAKVC
jgi:hypothetical protein